MEIVEMDELLSLETRLSRLSPETTQHSIYRVPRHLLDVNKKAFEPQIVAIGPYYHGRHELKRMEELKLRYMQQLVNRKPQVSVKHYISAMDKESKQRARDCYEESTIIFDSADAFTDMLVLDACFIIEVIHDPQLFMSTFPDRSSYRILQRDLILLENQIPFFVLCKLFDLIHGPEQHSMLMKHVLKFCEIIFPGNKLYRATTMRNSDDVKHILDLIHINWCPYSSDHRTTTSSDQGCCATWCSPTTTTSSSTVNDLIPSASELKGANVKFCNKEYDDFALDLKEDDIVNFRYKERDSYTIFWGGRETSLFDVEFRDSGKMLMPRLVIDDWTESLLRNLIAHEQLLPADRPCYFVDYIVLLDCLVNTSKDVHILCRANIIENLLGSEEAVADLVNKLGEGVMVNDKIMHADTFRRINVHHRKCAVAAFHRDYFNTPWAYIAFLAALMLFLLTAAQTAFSALLYLILIPLVKLHFIISFSFFNFCYAFELKSHF